MHAAVHGNNLPVLACDIPLCHSTAHALGGICLQLETSVSLDFLASGA